MMLKEHIAERVRPDPLHDRRRLLGRLDPAAPDRGQLSRACSTASSRTAASRTAGRPANEVNDCHLLCALLRRPTSPAASRAAQQAAVTDDADTGVSARRGMQSSRRSASRRASRTATCRGRRARRWSTTPTTNPTGCAATCRTTSPRSGASAPQDGFARSPLRQRRHPVRPSALNAGTITPEQFVALNEEIGGDRHRPQLHGGARRSRTRSRRRSRTAPARSRTASSSRTSRSSTCAAREQLFNDIHTDYHSYVLRARLDAANGRHANQLIWTWDGALVPIEHRRRRRDRAEVVPADGPAGCRTSRPTRAASRSSEKVLDDKPAGAIDECCIGAALTETTDAAACAAAFPYFGDARLAAGESWSTTRCSAG